MPLSPQHFPYTSIRLEITSQCNLNCSYCHNAQHLNKKNDLSTNELKILVTELKLSYPLKKILLTGGEPLLNRVRPKYSVLNHKIS